MADFKGKVKILWRNDGICKKQLGSDRLYLLAPLIFRYNHHNFCRFGIIFLFKQRTDLWAF
ncbi:hypothetical protein B4U42_05675 [Glaesserella parasuis 29755]|nr:hypothetical protein B4U42_05675 [Glaesserella parasuis 29755]